MTCSRPRSGLPLQNSYRSVFSPAFFLHITKAPETMPTKSLKPKGSKSANTPGNLLEPTAVTEMDAHGKRSETGRTSVIHQNAKPSSRSKSKTKTRATKTRRELLSQTSTSAFPAVVSKLDLTALARSVKNWPDLRQLVTQQHRRDEQFILKLLKLEWLQIKTIETERKRDRSKQSNGAASSSSSADIPPLLGSTSSPSINAKHGCGQDAAEAAKRRAALAVRPRSSYNYRDVVSRAGKTGAERRSGRMCVSPDLQVKHRSRNATATQSRLTDKELKESVRIMLELPPAILRQTRQN